MAAQRIIVVEDDPHFGQQLVDLFEFHGYEVHLAVTGADAISDFEEFGAELILTDLMLPQMGGVELIRAIRGLPGGFEPYVLMMSAIYKNPRMFERELRDLSVLEFIPKPFSLIDLGRKVDAILDVSLELDAADAAVTSTGSWRLEDVTAALGDAAVPFADVGSFDRRALLGMFVDIFRSHAAGRLILRRGRSEREVFFLNGYPVWATSDDSTDQLGEVMVRMGLIDAGQKVKALDRSKREGVAFREALIRAGYIAEGRLFRAERERVRRIVVQSFRWSDGEYEFVVGDDFVERVGVFEVNPVRCLSEAVAQFLSVNELAPDIEPRSAQRLIAGPRYRRLFPYLSLPPALEDLHSRMGTDVTVGDLFRQYPADPEALLKVLWLMFSLEIADSATEAVLRKAPTLEDIRPIREESEAGGFLPDAADLFDDGEDEEEIDPAQLSEPARVLIQAYVSLMEADYYHLLGVDRDASPADLAAAYRQHKETWTPARLGDAPSEVYTKAKSLLDRLEVAYRTLSDLGGRAAYDARLAILESGEYVQVSDAEVLQQAREHVAVEEWPPAERLLRDLAERHPDSIDVISLLGRVIRQSAQGDEARLREARDWLRRAEATDPDHLRTLRTLGEVARELGDRREYDAYKAKIVRADPSDPWLMLERVRAGRSR